MLGSTGIRPLGTSMVRARRVTTDFVEVVEEVRIAHDDILISRFLKKGTQRLRHAFMGF